MNKLQNILSNIDKYQQNHPALAFPVAVVKRYGDDKAGRQAALVTYYAFLSSFPLLLAFITVLGLVVSSNPHLEAQITKNVLQYFPALGNSISHSVHSLKGTGIALVLELLTLFYGARGLASVLQDTFNNVWHVEQKHRPGFIGDNLRSFGMMLAVGAGLIIGTALSYSFSTFIHIGVIGIIVAALLNLLITFGLFLIVFRLGTAAAINTRKLVLGAAIASTGTLIIQHFGSYIMSHELPKLNSSYGSFALALGLMFWIYLQAQVILYAIEVTAVRTQHDWPKKLL